MMIMIIEMIIMVMMMMLMRRVVMVMMMMMVYVLSAGGTTVTRARGNVRRPAFLPLPPSRYQHPRFHPPKRERERVALVPRPVLHFEQLALRGQTPGEWLSWLVALCGIERRQRLVPCPKPKPAACLCLSAEAWLGTSPSRQLASPTLTRRLIVHARRVRFKHSLSFVVD